MADRGDPPVSPNKRKHIVWNEQNLMYNEQNKSAKMTIDEPDTPWASPPRELFEDPAEDASVEKTGAEPRKNSDMDDVANRLRDIDTTASGGNGGDVNVSSSSSSLGFRGPAFERDAKNADEDAEKDPKRGSREKSEWDSSDDEADGARGGGDEKAPSRMAFPDPGSSAGDERGEPEDFEAHTDADRELKARLFEAQRKSHQCTFRGVMARGKALLDEEDEGE
jgi:hypothetical protein